MKAPAIGLLFVTAILLLMLSAISASADRGAPCTALEEQVSGCAVASGEFNDGGVDVSAGLDGAVGGGGGRGAAPVGGDTLDAGEAPTNPVGPLPDSWVVVRDQFLVNCTPGSPCDPDLVVSIRDLVNIKPEAAGHGMEPNGWSVIGLPANFYATAARHVRTGVLLGFPVEVLYTPVAYRWDFGDGTGVVSRNGGSRWTTLNLPEFSETETSHTFTAAGPAAVILTVDYSAQYRFAAQEWRPVRGTLAVPTAPLTVIAGEARTLLVNRECTRNALGPGC